MRNYGQLAGALKQVAGSFQRVCGRRVIRFDVPSAYGSCSSLQKIFPDETGRCRSVDLRLA